jgi:acetolactate decarboxylase
MGACAANTDRCRLEGSKMKARSLTVAILACALTLGCSRDSERISQFSTMNALMAGCYQGQFKCTDLTKMGDFGIGTFDKLDGEMVMLDGIIYQIKSDGSVYHASKNLLTPFAVVTSFSSDQQIELKGSYDLLELQKQIDSRLPGRNIFYAVRIDARFEYIRTRSVPAQEKPYRKLTEVVKDQPVFETTDTSGTLVGFISPDYVFPVNVPGYHLHFISDKRNFGGHLLECRARDPVVKIDHIRQIELTLPSGGDFDGIDLGTPDRNNLHKVEK